MSKVLQQFSDAVAAQTEAASRHVVSIQSRCGSLTGLLWQDDVVVASEQALSRRETYDVLAATGQRATATAAGRDPGTNVALLKLATPLAMESLVPVDARVGALALVVGVDGARGVTARLTSVHAAGEAWHSRAGGSIDRRIVLNARLGGNEDGAPVFDASGGFMGVCAMAPRRRTLVIPHATLARVIPPLLKNGRIARGWLGVALQPVAVPDDLRKKVQQRMGLMVMSVAPEGPAMQAGLLAGDIVLDIDGEGVRGIGGRLGGESIGRSVEVRFIRGGAVESLPLTVSERPDA